MHYCGSDYARLSLQKRGKVLVVGLARPRKLNAFDGAMWKEIESFFEAVRGDASCRAIILHGEGRAFTAGLDLKSGDMSAGQDDVDDAAVRALQIRNMGKQWQASFTNVAECGKPVIALAHNACIGAGVELLAAADVRWCTEDAFFAMKEVDIALAADVGGLQRFPKIVGNDSLVRELAFSGRRFLADEAEKMGFVSRVCKSKDAAMEKALELAHSIASKSPVASLGIKTFLNYSRDHSVAESLDYAITWNMAMIQSIDMKKAAVSFLTGEEPDFDDLPKSKL